MWQLVMFVLRCTSTPGHSTWTHGIRVLIWPDVWLRWIDTCHSRLIYELPSPFSIVLFSLSLRFCGEHLIICEGLSRKLMDQVKCNCFGTIRIWNAREDFNLKHLPPGRSLRCMYKSITSMIAWGWLMKATYYELWRKWGKMEKKKQII